MPNQSFLLYFTISLYAFCFHVQSPVLPSLLKRLQVEGSTQYGLIQSFFSFLQLLGTLVSGPFKDKYSSKKLLLLSIFASALSYLMTYQADSLTLVYLSKIPTIFQHAFLAAKTRITDESSTADRAARLGKLTLSYSVGLVLGPSLGGHLSDSSHAALVAAAGQLLSFVLVFCLFEDSPRSLEKQERPEISTYSAREAFRQILSSKTVLWLLLIRAFFGFGATILMSLSGLVMTEHFHLDQVQRGYVLSFIGVVSAIHSGLLVKVSVRNLGEARAIPLSLAGLSLAQLLYSQSTQLLHLCAVLTVITYFSSLFQNCFTSLLSQFVDKRYSGSLLGLEMGISSLLGIVSPILGGQIFQKYGFQYLGFLASALYFLALLISSRILPKKEKLS